MWAQCPTVADNTQSFCDLQSPTVSSLQATSNGAGVAWFAASAGGSALSPGTGLVSGQTYYADNAAGNCGSRQAVVVTVYGAPTGLNFQGVCVGQAGDATISDLQATGNNIRWYTTPSGGSPLSPSTQLNDNTIYYASQTNPDTGCESSRLSVFVNVGVVPTPTGPAIQQFCVIPGNPAPTINDLQASGVNNWYPTSTSAVQLDPSTPLVNGQSYYATTVDPPCESPNRLQITAQLFAPNNAGTNGTRGICANQTASTPAFNLFALLGGTPDATGTWSGPIVTTNGHLGTLNPSTMTLAGSPYVFTYTVNNGSCAPASATVTVTILPLPTAAISGNATICSNSSATVTFTGTAGATVTYTVNSGANQTVTLNASGTATLTNTYTATTTISLVSVASSGTPSCSQPVSGSVTITVLPLPTAAIASNVSICSGSTTTITFTGTPNAIVTYHVGSGPNQTITLNGSGSATLPTPALTATTTYTLVSVASAGSPSCTKTLTGSVTVTVIPQPTASVSGTASVCSGNPATITFTGTPNATVTYTLNGSTQTITLNASGTATLTGNYTATTMVALVSVSTNSVPACSAAVSGSAVITVLPLPTASIASNTTICSGSSASVTIMGTAGATVTYHIGANPNQTVTLNASGTAVISGTYTSTTTITLVSVASSGTPSCTQALSGSVTITVLPLPTASIASNTSICSGASATVTFTGTPNAVVTYHIGSNPNQTITLNASGTATLTNTYASTTTITLVSVATTGTPSCSQPVTGSVTITVIPPPTVSISGNATICSGSSASVTFTGTPGATVTYNTGGANQTVTLNASGTATITGTYTSTTTFTLVSVSTSGSPSCNQPATGSVTITVQPQPVATIASSTTICSGSSATVTITGTPGATVTYHIGANPNQTITLNASGTATITNTYSATTTITLVSVTTTGAPSCTQPLTGSVTITVLPPPTVSVSGTTSVCSGGSATVTFTGTPGAIVSFTVGGVAQTVTLNASGTATVSGTYTTTTTISLVNVTTPGSPGCTIPASGSVTITVISPPTVTIASSVSICPNTSATVTFTGTPNAVVTYHIGSGPNQTITLNASGTATITNTYAATTTITLVSVATSGTPGCSQTASGSVTITVIPPPTVTISGSTSVCSGGSATITFTGTPGAIITYTANGSTQTVTLNASGTATVSGTYTTTTSFTLVSATTAGTPGCSQPQTGSAVITVIPPPTVSVSGSTTLCSGGNATITFTGTPGAVVMYTVGAGSNQTITLNASGTATLTGPYSATTTITLVSVATSGTPSCTQPASGSVTITVLPPPTAAISASSTSICGGTSDTITITGTANATVTYHIGSGPNQTVTLDATGTATISVSPGSTVTYTLVSIATSGTPSCSQPLTGSVTITVIPPPQAGNDVANFTVCSTGAPVDLFTLLGTAQPGGTWSPALASGTGVFNPAVDTSGTYVYTVAGNAPCPSDSASVTVTVVQPPNAGNDASVAVCSVTTQDLFTSLGANAQPGGTWSPVLASGTGIFDPSVDTAGTYTYTVAGVAPCTTDSANVTVSISPSPDAGQSNTAGFCADAPSIDLFTLLLGTPQTTGTWTPALASGTGVFDPSVDQAGTYTYTVSSPGCADATATVTVSIIPPPNAGNDAVVLVCSSGTQNLFELLGPDAQPGGSWSPALSGGNIFDASTDSGGTFTYTVEGTNPCGSDSASVTVTITPAPNAGQDATLALCEGSAPQDLFAALAGTPQTGGTWSPALASGTGVFNPAVDASGVYTYTIFGTAPCPDAVASVTVQLVSPPNAGNDASVSVCSNATQDLFALLGANAQPGGTWSPVLSGGNIFDGATDATGAYTYTVSGAPSCPDDSAVVTVSVIQAPNAGQNGSVNICQSAAPQDLFTFLNGTPQPGGSWSPALASGTGMFDPSVDAAGVYTYTVGGIAVCANATASVTVQIVSPPNAGSDAVTNICSNTDPQDLFALLGADAQPGGTWSPALASGTGIFNPAIDTSGTYTYTVGNVAGCADDSATVAVTVVPGPDAGQNGAVTLCINSAPLDLFSALGGNPTPGGTWSPALASGTGVFDPAVDPAGVYVYALTGNAPCDNDSAVVAVSVNAAPDAGTNGSVSLCTSSAPQDLFNALGGTPQPGGTWSPALANGTGVFTPGVDAAGTYTYTVGGGFCSTAIASVTVSVTQAPNAGALGVPLATTLCPDITILDLNSLLNGSQDPGTWNDDDATGALSGNIFNATAVGFGVYHFTYTVPSGSPDCPPAIAMVTVTISQNPFAGVFDGAQPVCASAGTVDLNDLLINEQPGGVWTDASNTPVTNPLSLSGYTAGTYIFTYTVTNGCGTDTENAPLTILAAPSLSVSNITGTDAVCQGNNLPIQLSGMADGTYNITYDLTGANNASGLTATITVTSGNATLTVPASAVPNTGATVISFTLIQNTATNCSASLTNVQATLTVNPGSNIDSVNLSAANACKGNDVIVIISNATGLPDGTYHFNYNIPGATPATGTTADVTIAGGAGQFSLPSTLFPIAGNYTATITGIVATGNICGNASEDASVSFTILAVPDATGANVSAASTCVSFGTQVTISGATNLADGSYSIDYALSGANTATASVTVTFTSGAAVFSIPAAQLPAQGSTTLTISQLVSVSGPCGTAPGSFNSVTFDVSEPGTPTLLPQGNEFCGADHPTIATLSANITGGGNLIWYDAATGGHVVSADTALVNGSTYYAAFTAASGCEGPARLAVTVDLTKCNDILIPDGFSPNHDGINDTFEIVNLRDLYPKFHLEIYNRYGNILYKGNINTDDWDGTDHEGGLKMGNNVLPVGVYFYILEFNDGARQPVQGRVYLGR